MFEHPRSVWVEVFWWVIPVSQMERYQVSLTFLENSQRGRLTFQTTPSLHPADNEISFTSFFEIIWQGALNQHPALRFFCKMICKCNDYVTWNVFLSDKPCGLVWYNGQLYYHTFKNMQKAKNSERKQASLASVWVTAGHQLSTHEGLQLSNAAVLSQLQVWYSAYKHTDRASCWLCSPRGLSLSAMMRWEDFKLLWEVHSPNATSLQSVWNWWFVNQLTCLPQVFDMFRLDTPWE